MDTGVAAKWYLNEELEEEAARVLDAGSNGDARLIAPDPIGAEFSTCFGSIMWVEGARLKLSLSRKWKAIGKSFQARRSSFSVPLPSCIEP